MCNLQQKINTGRISGFPLEMGMRAFVLKTRIGDSAIKVIPACGRRSLICIQ